MPLDGAQILEDPLERATHSALDLRRAVDDLDDPRLRDLVNAILLELGHRIARVMQPDA